MDLENEILLHLKNEAETFPKRVQGASNIFKSSVLPVQSKTIVLKWILNFNTESEIVWQTIQDWCSSSNFRDITRNEVDTKEIKSIIDAFILKINSEDEENICATRCICNTVISLLGNRVFEQYFKIDIKLCLKLIDSVLNKIHCGINFSEFLNKQIFYKSLFSVDDFLTNFLHIIFPTFVNCLAKFNDKNMFNQVSRVTQRCIFYNNHKNYGNSINHFFENQYESKSGLYTLLKYFLKIYESNKESTEVHYKLGFHAFAVAYENDSLLIYKYFIILLHITGFNYEDVLPLESPLMPEQNIVTEKSKKILLGLLDVLEETKIDLRSKVNEVTLSDLLKTIVTHSILSDKPSALNYQLLMKVAVLDPTVTQTLTAEILKFTILSDNGKQPEDYEQLLLVIIDIFSKLQRIENLMFNVASIIKSDFEENIELSNIQIKQVLNENILKSFSRNIQNLASWQVINVFKTFLYALKEVVDRKGGLEKDQLGYCFRLEFLSELIGTFLSSIRVAEHTVATNVVEKTKKCLNELEEILKVFGSGLLNKKHNCSLMRSFLNIAYHWAEITIVLKYYSINREEKGIFSSDYNFAACNITYVHPYLSGDEWCLISERITNFGESSCKHLLYKLFIQKVRALILFEQKVNNEILQDLSRYLTRDLDDCWNYILPNKFLINHLLPFMDPQSVQLLVEKLITNVAAFDNFQKTQHILNNATILNAVVYAVIVKCDKIISKKKRKLNEDSKKLSSKICNVMKLELLYNENESKSCIDTMKRIYGSSSKVETDVEIKLNEQKVLEILEILRKFPVIFCKEHVQTFFILYVFSLHRDLCYEFRRGSYTTLQSSIENLIVGMLQQYKYKLDGIFNIEMVCQEILTNFNEWEEVFVLFVENMFKNKDAIVNYESLIVHITGKLNIPKYMQCGIIIINTLNKLKKTKISKEIKTVADNYRFTICSKIFELVLENDPQDYLIPGYVYSLKAFLAQNDEEKVAKLLNILENYIEFVLNNPKEFDKLGYLQLFNTILQNKTKIKNVGEDLPLRIWNACKKNDRVYTRFDEYSQLILLVVGFVSNEDFSLITRDLLTVSEQYLNKNKYEHFGNHLKTWISIVTSNINPVKTKNLQETLEIFLSQIMQCLEDSKFSKELVESVLNFQITIVQTNHFHVTPAMVDILLLNVTVLLNTGKTDFVQSFNLAVLLLSNLLKYRKSLIMDRLPPYLQQYRTLLKTLCLNSNSDVPKAEDDVRQLADCAFQLEKLTRSLVAHQKDMSRISMYLIADILDQYEKVTIFPNVKMHLNNCVYSLITICDQHAVSYLMRVLSSASTEIFKLMYDHYKKYYRFTGKA